MLGFAVVLVISAASMAIAYLGFERVSAGVASYRQSVGEADLARNIDRELISYRLLVRYYVVTGKEDDAKAAQEAETNLKNAIEQATKSATTPARTERIGKLAGEFNNFAATFAERVKAKQNSAQMVQNQLTRGGMSLRYKIEDLTGLAADAELQAAEFGFKQVSAQHQAAVALVNTFVVNGDQAVATSAQARIKFVENALHAISTNNDKIQQGVKEANQLLEGYRAALLKVVENGKLVAELLTQMSGSAGAIMQGSRAMKDDLVADQQRYEADSNAIVTETENMIVMLAVGGFLLGAMLAFLLGRGIS